MKIKNLFAAMLIALITLAAAESSFAQRVSNPGHQSIHQFNPDTLKPGEWLEPGDELYVNSHRSYRLILQTDGNLVLYKQEIVPSKAHPKDRLQYDIVDGAAMWNSKTAGKGALKAVMQTDGNFVIYNKNGKALWNTGTQGHPGSKLSLQTDGNLVIYGPSGKKFLQALWNTGTAGRY